MWNKLKEINWKDPTTILLVILVVLLPTVGGFYAHVGVVIGTIQALAILVLLKKSPTWAQGWVRKHPFIADLSLSAMATLGMSTLYGHGLILGISAVVTALLLSWALPQEIPSPAQ